MSDRLWVLWVVAVILAIPASVTLFSQNSDGCDSYHNCSGPCVESAHRITDISVYGGRCYDTRARQMVLPGGLSYACTCGAEAAR